MLFVESNDGIISSEMILAIIEKERNVNYFCFILNEKYCFYLNFFLFAELQMLNETISSQHYRMSY